VTIGNLKKGDVRIVLSMLYAPFDEMDIDERYGAPPEEGYLDDIYQELQAVEHEIETEFAADAAVAHNHPELDKALREGKVALIHAIEGGFQLGDSPAHVRANVRKLAGWGVAYVTLAHLFWRRVATNAPALPFLPDWVYNWWFPQPDIGLTDLGREAVRAMVEEHILIDVTHMSEDSLKATFALLDEIDPGHKVPVIAGHSAYRFGKLKYNLTEPNIQRIAGRGGVIGLIACKHYMTNGLPGRTDYFDQSLQVLRRHIDQLARVTGGYSHVALGSDLDGFIKPTLPGMELPTAFPSVRDFLAKQYGSEVASQICSTNAQRVLGYWRGCL
jgi:microsomal dipeptidase-like Zn-dependent dipeptidase